MSRLRVFFVLRLAYLVRLLGLVAGWLSLAGCVTLPGMKSPVLEGALPGTLYGHGVPGEPAVVLQSGWGDDARTWQKLGQSLSQEFFLVALDRPGHGQIPAVEGPRDPCTIAREQRAQLRQAGIPPPYVLVGHSLGGLYQYAYARMYPDEVAGLVLLDPTHPRHWEGLQNETATTALLVKTMATISLNGMDRAEFNDQTLCLNQFANRPPLGKPARLLMSGRFSKDAQGADFQRLNQRLRQDWLVLLGLPSYETVWDSGHYIHQENPEDVARALRAVFKEMALGRPGVKP